MATNAARMSRVFSLVLAVRNGQHDTRFAGGQGPALVPRCEHRSRLRRAPLRGTLRLGHLAALEAVDVIAIAATDLEAFRTSVHHPRDGKALVHLCAVAASELHEQRAERLPYRPLAEQELRIGVPRVPRRADEKAPPVAGEGADDDRIACRRPRELVALAPPALSERRFTAEPVRGIEGDVSGTLKEPGGFPRPRMRRRWTATWESRRPGVVPACSPLSSAHSLPCEYVMYRSPRRGRGRRSASTPRRPALRRARWCSEDPNARPCDAPSGRPGRNRRAAGCRTSTDVDRRCRRGVHAVPLGRPSWFPRRGSSRCSASFGVAATGWPGSCRP